MFLNISRISASNVLIRNFGWKFVYYIPFGQANTEILIANEPAERRREADEAAAL